MRENHNIKCEHHKIRLIREAKNHNLKLKNHNITLYVLCSLISLTFLSAILLSYAHNDSALAYDTTITVGVPASCTFTTGGGNYNDSISGGSGSKEITGNNITTSCNDAAGYAIYAIGYSGNSYTTNNTDLIASLNNNYNIKTDGTGMTSSNWKMKLTSVSNATIETGYSTYHNIPNTFTKVASYTSNTTAGTIKPSYQVNIVGGQPAGTYTGQVKYVLLHPSTMTPAESPELAYTITYNANGGSGTMTSSTMVPIYADFTLPTSTFTAPSGYEFAGWCTTNTAGSYACDGTSYTSAIPAGTVSAGSTLNLYAVWRESVPTLYDIIASMSKGTQNINALRAAIVAPTEAAPISSNSGVYEYNSAFGADSDGVNSNNEKETIYYYRGILDSYGHTGTYGSDGLADAYPNYVILDANGTKDTSDTCWRIVRTTGSGGVKMIYNGKWTGSTCANSSTSTNAVSDIYFNRGTTSSTNNYETKGRIAYVGYNYNQDYGYGGSKANESGSVANSTLFSNGTSSYIKTQVESWYTSNLTAYTSILETSAGYCNDRTTYTGETTDTLTDSTVPYKTSSAAVIFGAYIRNATTNSQPSLNCPNTTGYDLLTTSNGLTYPIALLTADEVSFAGSGLNGIMPDHANSYLRSGGFFWLLSMINRNSSGNIRVFNLGTNGGLGVGSVYGASSGVRPAISLASGTTATSGSGTATDPWVVTAP